MSLVLENGVVDVTADGKITSAPAITGDGTIIFSTSMGTVYAVWPDGSERWKTPGVGLASWGCESPSIGPDSTIYVPCTNDGLTALDPVDGSVKWRAPPEGGLNASPTALAIRPNGTLFFGAWDGDLYGISAGSQLASRLFLTDGEDTYAPDSKRSHYKLADRGS